jgi:methionyl-tRNA synthetase
MEAAGDLYLDRYEGWYSIRDEAFYDESELVPGEGGKLSPQGTPVEWTVEESWFFRLSNYQERLLALYRDRPDWVRPESRRNEIVRFVEGGLRDLSVSRTSFDWGVRVPGSDRHVMYVWVDALTNYLTGLGFPEETAEWNTWWPADLHLIGKDIVRFHAVYWPAFLMSAGLALPRQVFGHGFLLNRGQKESKSLGNVTDPLLLAERYGVDVLRYVLLREVVFGQDGSYSAEAIVTRANAELANSFGNLVQRVLSMIHKNLGGELSLFETTPVDYELQALVATACRDELPHAFETLNFSQGIEAWLRAAPRASLDSSASPMRSAATPRWTTRTGTRAGLRGPCRSPRRHRRSPALSLPRRMPGDADRFALSSELQGLGRRSGKSARTRPVRRGDGDAQHLDTPERVGGGDRHCRARAGRLGQRRHPSARG